MVKKKKASSGKNSEELLLVKIPKSFKISLKKKESDEKNDRLASLREEKKYNHLYKEHFQQEKSLTKSKIEMCKKIFAWKNKFLKTKEGAKIFKQSYKHLWVFGGNWAHELPEYGEYGCWSRIYFNANDIEYWAGYKWMPSGPTFHFKTPEDMAKKLDSKYLKEFLEKIENKKIFKNILELNLD